MGLLATVAGDYRAAMLWMLATLVIDGVDGTFARMARVQEELPGVSGKTIDYVIDFFTYCILPAYLFYVAIDMPEIWRLLGSFLMLMSGAIYYGLEEMVSEDGNHFVGFPVMWNMVVYVFLFVVPYLAWPVLFGLVVFFAVLHFVPILFAYPSHRGRWWGLTIGATVLFIGAAVVNVWFYPEPIAWARWATLLTLAYYAVLAGVDTWAERGKSSH